MIIIISQMDTLLSHRCNFSKVHVSFLCSMYLIHVVLCFMGWVSPKVFLLEFFSLSFYEKPYIYLSPNVYYLYYMRYRNPRWMQNVPWPITLPFE